MRGSDLPVLHSLTKQGRRWAVRTVSGPPRGRQRDSVLRVDPHLCARRARRVYARDGEGRVDRACRPATSAPPTMQSSPLRVGATIADAWVSRLRGSASRRTSELFSREGLEPQVEGGRSLWGVDARTVLALLDQHLASSTANDFRPVLSALRGEYARLTARSHRRPSIADIPAARNLIDRLIELDVVRSMSEGRKVVIANMRHLQET